MSTSSLARKKEEYERKRQHSAMKTLEGLHYRVGKTIGNGSYGKVMSGYSEKFEMKVAIKIIHRSDVPGSYIDNFISRELEVVRKVHHPNVITFLQSIETNNRVYFIMELADKGDLLSVLMMQKVLEEPLAGFWFRQLVSAVGYCHSIGIAHRDLKAEHILFDNKNNLKLTDFGFSKSGLLPKGDRYKISYTFCGSYAYSSPQILMSIPYVPQMNDIWSIGVILYLMVIGYMPFEHHNYNKLVEQVQEGVQFTEPCPATESCKDLVMKILVTEEQFRSRMDTIEGHDWFIAMSPKNTALDLERLAKVDLTQTEYSIESPPKEKMVAAYTAASDTDIKDSDCKDNKIIPPPGEEGKQSSSCVNDCLNNKHGLHGVHNDGDEGCCNKALSSKYSEPNGNLNSNLTQNGFNQGNTNIICDHSVLGNVQKFEKTKGNIFPNEEGYLHVDRSQTDSDTVKDCKREKELAAEKGEQGESLSLMSDDEIQAEIYKLVKQALKEDHLGVITTKRNCETLPQDQPLKEKILVHSPTEYNCPIFAIKKSVPSSPLEVRSGSPLHSSQLSPSGSPRRWTKEQNPNDPKKARGYVLVPQSPESWSNVSLSPPWKVTGSAMQTKSGSDLPKQQNSFTNRFKSAEMSPLAWSNSEPCTQFHNDKTKKLEHSSPQVWSNDIKHQMEPHRQTLSPMSPQVWSNEEGNRPIVVKDEVCKQEKFDVWNQVFLHLEANLLSESTQKSVETEPLPDGKEILKTRSPIRSSSNESIYEETEECTNFVTDQFNPVNRDIQVNNVVFSQPIEKEHLERGKNQKENCSMTMGGDVGSISPTNEWIPIDLSKKSHFFEEFNIKNFKTDPIKEAKFNTEDSKTEPIKEANNLDASKTVGISVACQTTEQIIEMRDSATSVSSKGMNDSVTSDTSLDIRDSTISIASKGIRDSVTSVMSCDLRDSDSSAPSNDVFVDCNSGRPRRDNLPISVSEGNILNLKLKVSKSKDDQEIGLTRKQCSIDVSVGRKSEDTYVTNLKKCSTTHSAENVVSNQRLDISQLSISKARLKLIHNVPPEFKITRNVGIQCNSPEPGINFTKYGTFISDFIHHKIDFLEEKLAPSTHIFLSKKDAKTSDPGVDVGNGTNVDNIDPHGNADVTSPCANVDDAISSSTNDVFSSPTNFDDVISSPTNDVPSSPTNVDDVIGSPTNVDDVIGSPTNVDDIICSHSNDDLISPHANVDDVISSPTNDVTCSPTNVDDAIGSPTNFDKIIGYHNKGNNVLSSHINEFSMKPNVLGYELTMGDYLPKAMEENSPKDGSDGDSPLREKTEKNHEDQGQHSTSNNSGSEELTINLCLTEPGNTICQDGKLLTNKRLNQMERFPKMPFLESEITSSLVENPVNGHGSGETSKEMIKTDRYPLMNSLDSETCVNLENKVLNNPAHKKCSQTTAKERFPRIAVLECDENVGSKDKRDNCCHDNEQVKQRTLRKPRIYSERVEKQEFNNSTLGPVSTEMEPAESNHLDNEQPKQRTLRKPRIYSERVEKQEFNNSTLCSVNTEMEPEEPNNLQWSLDDFERGTIEENETSMSSETVEVGSPIENDRLSSDSPINEPLDEKYLKKSSPRRKNNGWQSPRKSPECDRLSELSAECDEDGDIFLPQQCSILQGLKEHSNVLLHAFLNSGYGECDPDMNGFLPIFDAGSLSSVKEEEFEEDDVSLGSENLNMENFTESEADAKPTKTKYSPTSSMYQQNTVEHVHYQSLCHKLLDSSVDPSTNMLQIQEEKNVKIEPCLYRKPKDEDANKNTRLPTTIRPGDLLPTKLPSPVKKPSKSSTAELSRKRSIDLSTTKIPVSTDRSSRTSLLSPARTVSRTLSRRSSSSNISLSKLPVLSGRNSGSFFCTHAYGIDSNTNSVKRATSQPNSPVKRIPETARSEGRRSTRSSCTSSPVLSRKSSSLSTQSTSRIPLAKGSSLLLKQAPNRIRTESETQREISEFFLRTTRV